LASKSPRTSDPTIPSHMASNAPRRH